jgi:hypothetical protein
MIAAGLLVGWGLGAKQLHAKQLDANQLDER